MAQEVIMDYSGWDMRTPWKAEGTHVLNVDGDVAVPECRNDGESVVHANDRARMVAEAVNDMAARTAREVKDLRWTRDTCGPGMTAWTADVCVGHVSMPLCSRADGRQWEVRMAMGPSAKDGVESAEQGKRLVQERWASIVVRAVMGAMLVLVPWQMIASAF